MNTEYTRAILRVMMLQVTHLEDHRANRRWLTLAIGFVPDSEGYISYIPISKRDDHPSRQTWRVKLSMVWEVSLGI